MNGRRGYYQKFKRIGKKLEIKYLHTMVRVKDLEKSIAFYNLLGLKEIKRSESEIGRFTLVFLAPAGARKTSVNRPISLSLLFISLSPSKL